ncbi:MAG: hypothetical protein HYS06_13550 [Methylocystis sp.]|nr:hypothetical protein [Methylocystis sp.]
MDNRANVGKGASRSLQAKAGELERGAAAVRAEPAGAMLAPNDALLARIAPLAKRVDRTRPEY